MRLGEVIVRIVVGAIPVDGGRGVGVGVGESISEVALVVVGTVGVHNKVDVVGDPVVVDRLKWWNVQVGDGRRAVREIHVVANEREVEIGMAHIRIIGVVEGQQVFVRIVVRGRGRRGGEIHMVTGGGG